MTNIDQIINGLMPDGKPTLDEAKIYFQEALTIKHKVETFLLDNTKK